jgi:dUTP pyrophosphatase
VLPCAFPWAAISTVEGEGNVATPGLSEQDQDLLHRGGFFGRFSPDPRGISGAEKRRHVTYAKDDFAVPCNDDSEKRLASIMASLSVKLLDTSAKLPTVAHPGEDIGYDLYASQDHTLLPGQIHRVHTGVAVAGEAGGLPLGFLVKDRSSMASKGVFTHGGVIDSSYRGEIVVLMTTLTDVYQVRSGDRIAQLIPTPVLTGTVSESTDLTSGARGSKGFGSSGR